MTTAIKVKEQLLSEIELASYRKDGYVIPQYRLPVKVLSNMREALDKLIADNPTIRPEMLMGIHIAKGYTDGVQGRREFFDMATYPPLLDMVEQLIGPDIIFWASQVICKPGGDGMEVPWHQDGEYWPIRPLATCTVWIALEDALPENGCMRVIPGSHRDKKLCKHYVSQREDLVLNQVLEEGVFDESNAVDIALRAGQLSIHDAYTVHGSNANRSDKRRAGYVLRYMPSTSHFDRGMQKRNLVGKDTRSATNFATRPIWLLRGVDLCGKNDFKPGLERAFSVGL